MFDSCNGHHRDLQYHPEQPERIVACVKALDKARNERGTPLELIDIAPAPEAIHSEGGKHAIITTTHRPFSREELEYAREILLETHEKSLVTKLEEKSEKSRRLRIDAGKSPLGHMGYIDFDTYLTTETFNVCLRATAAWIRATNIAMGKESSSTGSSAAIALTRPPGHHATFDNSNGFCHFNFAAAAAVHVMRQYPNSRVSILDWDVHYGQGVADIIRRHDRARFVSIHQTPAFPYQGEKFGIQGQHTNVFTIPMPAETSWTCGYKDLFEKALAFISEPDVWEPDVVIVCAGYDALASDELASVSLQANDFGQMTKQLWEHLTKSKKGKAPAVAIGLEGGYQLSPMTGAGGNLPDAVVETALALIEQRVGVVK